MSVTFVPDTNIGDYFKGLDIRFRSNDEFANYYEKIFSKGCKNITFIVTRDCNLRCTYCYEKHKENYAMSFETAKKAVDFLFEEDEKQTVIINNKDADCIILEFIGGEPLIEIKLIDKILDYFVDKAISLNHRWARNFLISMSSNGVLYFAKDVQDFLHKYEGKFSMNISIDGNKQLHDKCRLFPDGRPSYDIAMAAAKDLKERFGQNSTKMTISPENIEYLSDACINLIQELECDVLHANPVYEEGWKPYHAKIYYDQLKKFADYLISNNLWKKFYTPLFKVESVFKHNSNRNSNWCGGNGRMLAFDVDGRIYPCLRFSPVSMPKHLSENCVLGDVWQGIHGNEEFFNSLREITWESQNPEKCKKCSVSNGCAWCTAYNYEVFGTPNKRATFICDLQKADSLATVYYYNTILKQLNSNKRLPLLLEYDECKEYISKSEYQTLQELLK